MQHFVGTYERRPGRGHSGALKRLKLPQPTASLLLHHRFSWYEKCYFPNSWSYGLCRVPSPSLFMLSSKARPVKAAGLFSNIGSNWLVLALGIVATYILLPITIRMLGQKQYGVWLLINSITAYLGLLVLGVPMATVRYIARDLANEDYEGMNARIGTCAGLYLGMGVASLVIGAGLLVAFERFYTIPPELVAPARIAFWFVLLYVATGFLGHLPVGILSAHNDFVTSNLILSSLWVMRFIMTINVLYLYSNLIALGIVQLILLLLQSGIMWAVIFRKYRYICFRSWKFDWSAVRLILPFSLFALVLNLSARLSFETDTLVIGRFLDVAKIPYYAVANNVSMYLMEFIIAIASVVMPTATRLETAHQYDELKDVYLKWSKIAFSLSLFAGVYLLIFGPAVMGWWIGPAYETSSGEILQILMVSNLVFLPARGVCLPMLMGMGYPGKATLAFLFSAVLNLVMSIVLVRPLGLAGVAWGTAIPSVVFGIAVWVLAGRVVRVSAREYFNYVVIRPVIGALPVATIMLAYQTNAQVRGLVGLGATGTVMAALFAMIWIMFVYHNDRLVRIQALLPAFRGR